MWPAPLAPESFALRVVTGPECADSRACIPAEHNLLWVTDRFSLSPSRSTIGSITKSEREQGVNPHSSHDSKLTDTEVPTRIPQIDTFRCNSMPSLCRSRSVYLLVVIGAILVTCGCGSDVPQTVKVSGKVTFDGGRPLGPGVVYFLPLEAAKDFPTRPGNADFGADGSFTAYTFDPGDGLMPGKYGVYVECWETAPNMDGKPVKSFLPAKYQSAETSGLELEITADMRSKAYDINVVTK